MVQLCGTPPWHHMKQPFTHRPHHVLGEFPGSDTNSNLCEVTMKKYVLLAVFVSALSLLMQAQANRDAPVALMGQVSRPTLKSDAENVVKRIEGVTKVVNNLEVLPTSINDDRIRRDVYRAIYGNSVLSQYQLRAVPPIHIIVNNGHVTLEGAVARAMDKQVAGMQANQVPGVFSVTNNLQVEEEEKKKEDKKDEKK